MALLFTRVSTREELIEALSDWGITADPAETDLDLAEELASMEAHVFTDEEQVSAVFDDEILPYVVATYGENDQPAIDEAFNDWTDSLCKEGLLHDSQYSNYTYVGRLAEK